MISRRGIYPKRFHIITRLDGCDPIFEKTVHLDSYTCLRRLRTEKLQWRKGHPISGRDIQDFFTCLILLFLPTLATSAHGQYCSSQAQPSFTQSASMVTAPSKPCSPGCTVYLNGAAGCVCLSVSTKLFEASMGT